MTSPTVWTDAKARITAAAATLTLPVAWPNEPFDETTCVDASDNPTPFLGVETQANGNRRIEIGSGAWEEEGVIWLYVTVPTFSGIDTAFSLRMSLSDAFRNITDAPDGLVYRGSDGVEDQIFDPLGIPSDNGNYRPLPLGVRYVFQNRPV